MRSVNPTIDELHSDAYEELARLRHKEIATFAAEWFWRRPSTFVRLHHATSLAVLAGVVGASFFLWRGVGDWFASLGIAFVGFIVVVLPLHEAIHAAAYRAVGARAIRWSWTSRGLAVYVLAHREVVGRRDFTIVALAPFVTINAMLLAGAVVWRQQSVAILLLLLLHIGGTAGDWALLNFFAVHRDREVFTYDDGDTGETFFFARAGERGLEPAR